MTDRPTFFVPGANDADTAERVWEATSKHVGERNAGRILDTRIFRLGYLHDGKHMQAEVGKPHPWAKAIDWRAFKEVGEPQVVLAILERECGIFLVCTLDRGVERGDPIVVGSRKPYEIVEQLGRNRRRLSGSGRCASALAGRAL